MKITIVKKDYWFVLWDIKKIVLWQDYFCFVDEFGLIHQFGILEVEKIYADDKIIYEKH